MGVAISRIGHLVMQGVLDSAAWDEGLSAITRAVRADHLVAILPQEMDDPHALVMPLAWGSGVADENIWALADYPADVAVLSRLLPAGRMVVQDDVVPLPVLCQLAVFEGAIRPMGGRHAAVARTTAGGFVAACRSRWGKPFSDGERTTLTDLLPILTSALNLKRHMQLLKGRVATLEAALDDLSTGVIFLDAQRRILHVNSAAETIFARTGQLLTMPAMLWGGGGMESRRLAQIIDESSGAITLVRSEMALPLAVRALRMPAPEGGAIAFPRKTATILFVSDPNRPAPAGIAGLCAAFGLTPRETDIVALLVAGEGPADIAARLGISLGNVRGHLNRIFGKTGTGSQAQLIALCLSAVH
ncbi:LuxR C-terminal-related transcriptional regulator [Rhizobiales bacterium 3FA27D7]|jgi:DNA-binding CsgD family transcriptional regulator/PAS domain-containing protein|uniref:helix-turn-helix transcriptional regulator n=1 Tax=Mesorhizobium sp. 2RAF21 TaxID=3232995 RepID=UPI0010F973A9